MSRCKLIGYGLTLAGLLAVAVGCPSGPPRISPPAINASQAAARAIEMYDANKDGKLSGAELDKCPGLKSAAARLDPNGQGITAEMIAERINAWLSRRTGRMSAFCVVCRNGKPLEGAEVKLVPEKFLGLGDDPKWIATGTTGKIGGVSLSVPTSGQRTDPAGVPPGFYRIEITKPGLDIPAKYNTETVLGVEIARQRAVGGGDYQSRPDVLTSVQVIHIEDDAVVSAPEAVVNDRVDRVRDRLDRPVAEDHVERPGMGAAKCVGVGSASRQAGLIL